MLVASVEELDDARKTQAQFPHLTVLADHSKGLSEAVALIHSHAGPDGRDADAPTTILVDRQGTVRWLYRSPAVNVRLSPEDVLREIDRRMLLDHATTLNKLELHSSIHRKSLQPVAFGKRRVRPLAETRSDNRGCGGRILRPRPREAKGRSPLLLDGSTTDTLLATTGLSRESWAAGSSEHRVPGRSLRGPQHCRSITCQLFPLPRTSWRPFRRKLDR